MVADSATATRRSGRGANLTLPARLILHGLGALARHSTLTLEGPRRSGPMVKAGRWLAADYCEITEPGQWTRSTAYGRD